MDKMSLVWTPGEIAPPAPVPRLLVELPSWPQVFFSNLGDLVFPSRLPPLELRSAPAPYWPDVFVQRRLPWERFLQSGAFHAIVFALLIGFTRFFALQPQVVARPTFDHAQVIYYQPSEYLPPLDTRSAAAPEPRKADPEFSAQPIISVPREADNRAQTIVAPPRVRLKSDVALPNIVAWSDNVAKPRLAIPPVPLTPAAEITRIAPSMQNSVVTPPPDAAHLSRHRNSPTPQNSVVAPPPDVNASNASCVSGFATRSGRASAECRFGIHPAAWRSQHWPEFGDRARASTSGRRATYDARVWIVIFWHWSVSASRSASSVGFGLRIFRGLFWSARPRDCPEPASCRRSSSESASRESSRHLCGDTGRSSRRIRFARSRWCWGRRKCGQH